MTRFRYLVLVLTVVLLITGCNRNTANQENTTNTTASAEPSPPPEVSPSPMPIPEPAPPPPKTAAAPKPAQKAEAPAKSAPKPAAPVRAAAPPPAEMPKPKPPLVVPAGTVLAVRLEQAVGSKTSEVGQRFEVTLAKPIVVAGQTAIPQGASGSGTVTEAHAAGRFKGGASLALALDTLTVQGTTYKIQTMPATQASKGKGKRTAGMIGGGAGAGALIGGLAGGGKGAAIGAAVGAGAGTAGAGLTGDRDITLPTETLVEFQMTAPLTLKTVGTQAP